MTTKKYTSNTGKIWNAMGMRWCNVERIAQWSTPQASIEATECHHRASTRIALPWEPPWLTILVENTKP